jgi:phospholipase C
MLDFTSMLKFIEQNWNITPLAARDINANNFLSAFDFNQSPRLPNFLPLARVSVAPVKKDPSKVIYLGYGAGLSLAIIIIGLANFHSNRVKARELKRRTK